MKTYADRIARLEAKVRELETDAAIRGGRATDLSATGARPIQIQCAPTMGKTRRRMEAHCTNCDGKTYFEVSNGSGCPDYPTKIKWCPICSPLR